MLDGGRAAGDAAARELGMAVVLHPPVPLRMRRLVETGELHHRRAAPRRHPRSYGCSWDPRAGAGAAAAPEYVKRVLVPLLPGAVRYVSVAGGRLFARPSSA